MGNQKRKNFPTEMGCFERLRADLGAKKGIFREGGKKRHDGKNNKGV